MMRTPDMAKLSGPQPDQTLHVSDLCVTACRAGCPGALVFGPLNRMADEFGHLPRRPARMLMATVWSMQGLRAAWLHESSFRLEVYLLVPLAPLALWLGNDGVERALLLGSCLLVLLAELLNSAIEAVIARYGDERHELAGRAKDMGSAAVFVAMVNVLLVWGLVLAPRWI